MSEYKQGYIDGLRAYAWWKDGRQQVGNCGTLLKDAEEKAEKTWNYQDPANAPAPKPILGGRVCKQCGSGYSPGRWGNPNVCYTCHTGITGDER